MAAVNNLVSASNDLIFSVNEIVQPDDGLADDDSWVENISQSEEDLNEFDNVTESPEETDREEKLRGFNCSAIDFTLHTIVEESCEDSEIEHSDYEAEESKEKNIGDKTSTSPSCLERYFFFGLGDGERSNTLEDSSSEIFSDCSDNLDTTGSNDVGLSDTKSAVELSTSRLEKYFLSGFLGFSAETKSDGSVGSDSEGQPSPSQRKKKFVRARGTPRSHNSSLDNLLVESADIPLEQFTDNVNSSESETESCSETGIVCDKLDNIDSLKRKKNYRKRELLEQKFYVESGKTTTSIQNVVSAKHKGNFVKDHSDVEQLKVIKANGFTTLPPIPTKTSLVRKDSFNNWSSDEETNLMMSKMRQFFKTLIAVTTQNYNQSNNFSTYPEKYFHENPSQLKTKAVKFSYFENELIRLMKTVPGINNQQVREIVEYFSSEDTWSDSNDSSDCNASNIDTPCRATKKNEHFECSKDKKDNFDRVDDDGLVDPRILNTDTVLVYTNLIESLITNNSTQNLDDISVDDKGNNHGYGEKSPQLLAKVMQHIGRKLVALMHDVSIGTESGPQHSQKLLLKKDVTSSEENSTKFVLDHLDCTPILSNDWGHLPRSKSHDLLLGSNNRSWHFNSSNTVNENAGEVSDCDRFSWRGSFESALLAPGDSRSKLLTVDRDNCSLTSEISISKRRSVDNLTYSIIQNGEQLDRVQSCGSIGVVDKQNSSEAQMWLSSLSDAKNKTALEPSSRIDIEDLHSTNSLPRLQSLQFSPNISDKSKSDSNVIQCNAKSARYRSPVTQGNAFSSSITKRNTIQATGHYPLNNLQRSITSSTSLDDFSISEFSSNINKSPGMQRNQFHRRNNTNFGMRCDSLTSVYSDVLENQYGSVRVKGEIMFGMQYNYKISALEIHIVKCKDLAAVDTKRCKSDPYVKVYLLPDKSKSGKRKTKVKKHTLNPVFDEIIRFYVSISNLKTRSIWLTVWHSDMFGRNDFLGEVTINLEGKVFDNPQSQWYILQEKNTKVEQETACHGDIVVGLKFITLGNSQAATADSAYLSKKGIIKPYLKGQLHILIKEAKNLCSPRASGTCDTFCKSYLLPNRTRSSKQKTSVIKKSLNPVWNSTFIYDGITLQELSERALELTIWDHDRLISNQLLGGVRFSLGTGKHYGNKVNWMDSTGKELYLWQEMLNRPNFWVEGSVNLRSNFNVKRELSNES